jgi:predicted dehydrogenase
VHDLIGHNHLIIERTSRVIRGGRDGPVAAAALAERRAALVEEAIGSRPAPLAAAYDLLLGLGSHDMSAMRELLGSPRGVASAALGHEGRYVSASIDYGSFACHYETGVDHIPRFDAHIEVFGDTRTLRVQYDTPYVRNLPVRLTVVEANGHGGVVERRVHPEWGDPFVYEWQAFADHVRERSQPPASAADYRNDLELFGEMVELMAASEAAKAAAT